MKKTLVLGIIIVIIGGFFVLRDKSDQESPNNTSNEQNNMDNSLPIVSPISHATFVLSWDDTTIYNDPIGDEELYANFPSPDLILLTDIHPDHLNVETLESITMENFISSGTIIIAPQAVADKLPERLLPQTLVMANGDKTEQKGISIEAVPMYNIPENPDVYHTKGRGNGYLLEKDGKRIYIAGDTSGIPEMRALKNIDIAFVPMNLPYTMDINEAADAVLEFKPKIVYPYHYRNQGGLSDVEKFKEMVTSANPDIEVILGNWY